MKTRNLLILAIACSITATGCSRFRGLRRDDYALTKDPFTEAATGHSESAEPPIDGMRAAATGVAQVSGSSEADGHTARADYENVPNDSTSTAQPAEPGRSTQVAANSDALNPFAGLNAAAGTLDAGFHGNAKANAGDVRTAAAADMAAFLQQQTNQAKTAAVETAENARSDFAQFAQQKKQQWAHQVSASTEAGQQAVTDITTAATDEAAAVFNGLTAAADQATESVFAGLPTENPAVATPLIDRPVAAEARAAGTPPIGSAEPFGSRNPIAGNLGPQGAVAEPVFDKPIFDEPANAAAASADTINPFAAFEPNSPPAASNASATFADTPTENRSAKPATSNAAASETGRNTQDVDFSFDGGWQGSGFGNPQ